MNFNFNILPNGQISILFLHRGLHDFLSAANYIKQLPYRRNKNKKDLATVLSDECGTCSTKHAVLKQLCIENNIGNARLVLGIFRMNKINTPRIASTLSKYSLDFIPEAHTYLDIDGIILDCTKPNSSAGDFVNDLLLVTEIEPGQITEFKVNYHKAYLENWVLNQGGMKYSLADIWAIREQCITDLCEG